MTLTVFHSHTNAYKFIYLRFFIPFIKYLYKNLTSVLSILNICFVFKSHFLIIKFDLHFFCIVEIFISKDNNVIDVSFTDYSSLNTTLRKFFYINSMFIL